MIFNQLSQGGQSGASPFTLIVSETFQLSYDSTTAASEWQYFPGLSQYFPDGVIRPLYVKLRDENGPRNGYYYGFDALCLPRYDTQGAVVQSIYRYDDSGERKIFNPASATSPTAGYGIWLYACPILQSSSGRLDLRLGRRYNATNSYTIDGTYTLEVYLVELPE